MASHQGSSSSTVQGIELFAIGNNDGDSTMEEVLIENGHPIFNSLPTPASVAFGFPLLLDAPELRHSKNKINENATWLMIDPKTGFAPMEWLMNGAGDVLVVRADKEPLSVAVLRAILDYILEILLAAEDGPVVVGAYYDKERLDKYIARHLEMQKDHQSCVNGSRNDKEEILETQKSLITPDEARTALAEEED